MAVLPGEEWLIQQESGIVRLFNRYTEEVLVEFDPSDANATAQAQKVIYELPQLDPEQKSFASFWSGYFYRSAVEWGISSSKQEVVVDADGNRVIVRWVKYADGSSSRVFAAVEGSGWIELTKK